MNSATLIPTDITVPDWLQDCLREQQSPTHVEQPELSTKQADEQVDEQTADALVSNPLNRSVNSTASPSLRSSTETSLVCDAFTFAYALHRGQRRASGEPYIAHPVAVAGLLRELGGSPAMIAAGFLHDVIEDTDVTAEEIEQRFGPEVRRLVEAVTKLSKFNFSSKTERLAENFRRMFLAIC